MLQDVSLCVQTFQVVPTKTILPFLQKGGKTSELSFFSLKLLDKILNRFRLFFFNLKREYKIPK